MPRLSERQQVALLLRATRPSLSYPPLSHCLALHSVSPSVYASWTPGRRRLWDRRRIDPASYLYSYLPPAEPARAGKFTLSEHTAFLAALQRLPSEPANERWARLAVLMPGRVGGECRRYYHRVGRAGFITPDGNVRGKLVCRARLADGKKLVKSANALFLRRNLSKFVPAKLPTLDDAMLRRPGEQAVLPAQIELLTYRPAKEPRRGSDAGLKGKMGALSVVAVQAGENGIDEMERGRSKKNLARRTKLNKVAQKGRQVTPKTKSPASSSVKMSAFRDGLSGVACSIPPSARKPPLPKPVCAGRKQAVRGGTAAEKPGGDTAKPLAEKSDLTPPACLSEGAVKKTSVNRSGEASAAPAQVSSKPGGAAPLPLGLSRGSGGWRSANGNPCKPILLKLRIKKLENQGPRVHSGSHVTVNNRSGNSASTITRQPGAPRRVSNGDNKSVASTRALKVSTSQGDALAKRDLSDIHAAPGLTLDVPRIDEACEKYPGNPNATQRIIGDKETTGCVHKPTAQNHKTFSVSDNPEQWRSKTVLDRRQGSGVPGTNTGTPHAKAVHPNCESVPGTKNEETNVPRSILLPSSRRLYGPSKPNTPPADSPLPSQEDPHAISTLSAMVNSANGCSIVGNKTNVEQVSAPSRNEHEGVYSCTSTHSASSRVDTVVPGTRKSDDAFSSNPTRLPVAALEPFQEDDTISLMDPNESISEDKLDAVSEDSPLHTAPPTYEQDVVPTLSPGVLVEREPLPLQERMVGISAPENDKKRASIDFLLCSQDHLQPLELPQKRRHVERKVAVQQGGEEKYCCNYCRHRCEGNIHVDVYEVAEGTTSDDVFSWSLPRMGVTWTRAWASRHWSALLPEDDLRSAELKFATMQQQAWEIRELIKSFQGTTCATGVSLGHRGERQRLLREFEARYGTLVESGSLVIRHVTDSSKASGRPPSQELPISRREQWGPQYHLCENTKMGYEDMVTRLAEIWDAGMTEFLQRVTEMETRQEMETHAVDSIRSVMAL